MAQRVVVTGGTGFIGSYLVRRLVKDGWDVGVVDTMVRGDVGPPRRGRRGRRALRVRRSRRGQPGEARSRVPTWSCTSRRSTEPRTSTNIRSWCSMSASAGAIAVVNAGRTAGVSNLVAASSAEVYQTPAIVPTPEAIPLTLPDSLNPRYSYGGSKIATELKRICFNYAQDHYDSVQVFDRTTSTDRTWASNTSFRSSFSGRPRITTLRETWPCPSPSKATAGGRERSVSRRTS